MPHIHIENTTVQAGVKIGVQRFFFPETTYVKDAETDDMAVLVHTLHHGVVLGFSLVTDGVGKTDFKEIRFRVELHLHFIGHTSSPAFG